MSAPCSPGTSSSAAPAFSIGVELVDVDDGSRLWGTVLSGRIADGFALQTQISEELTGVLRVRLSRQRKKAAREAAHRESPRPISCICADATSSTFAPATRCAAARTFFERAVAQDPGYALAHAGLADCCSLLAVSLRGSSGTSLIEAARAAALRGLRLDDESRRGARVARLHQVPVRLGLGGRGRGVHAGAGAQSRTRAIAPVVCDVPRVTVAVR